MKCDRCEKETEEVKRRSSMTLYEGEDVITDPVTLTQRLVPDSGPVLCEPCWEEYQEHWTMMWEEYRSSQGV